jgi:methionine-S-sulfoxide reductase
MNTNEKSFATLAGGCFWGVEELFRALPGVLSTQVGYTGGHTKDPTYNDVKRGNTGHTESIQITFDEKQISYKEILTHFFNLHDPTTPNRQGNDRGSQYRSVIFFHSELQKKIAIEVREKVEQSGFWSKPLPKKVVTEVVPFEIFYLAEDFHQKYLQKNPGGYTCHYLRDSR